MTPPHQSYRSYLLRLWMIPNGGRLVLRASLESAQTGERVGFGSLDQVYDFLQRQVGEMQDMREGKHVDARTGPGEPMAGQI